MAELLHIYDRARPMCDAAIRDVDALAKDATPASLEAARLGAALQSVVGAYVAGRVGMTRGSVRDADLFDILVGAFGSMLGGASMSFRPVGGAGRPLPPTVALDMMLSRTALAALKVLKTAQTGGDNVAWTQAADLDPDGVPRPQPFDLRDMLKGGARG